MVFDLNLMKETLKPKIRMARESIYLLNRNPLSRTALVVILLIVLMAVFAPYIIPYPSILRMRPTYRRSSPYRHGSTSSVQTNWAGISSAVLFTVREFLY